MATSEVTSVASGLSDVLGTTSYASSASDITGKDDFLNLLCVQLKYQDPMAPMENQDFLAQLAQFSSLEQLMNANGNLQANFLMTQSVNNSVAAGFIGKTVKASGDEVYLSDSGDVSINYTLDSMAKVTVKIYDENNNLVRTITDDSWKNKGDGSVVWDGESSGGARLAPGKYTFAVSAVDSEDNAASVTSFIEGKVTGVRFTSSGAVFMIGGLEVDFSDILEVKETSVEGGD